MTVRGAWVGVAAAAAVLAGCGGGSGGGGGNAPTAPSGPVARTILTVTLTAIGERTGNGYLYDVRFQVRESGGLGATLSAVDLEFFNGTTPDGTVHVDSPLAGTNRVNANGTADSKQILITDDRAGAPFNTRVQALISYRDDNQQTGTVTVSADIPALPANPPAGNLRLTGTVRSGSLLVANVLIEIRTGPNAGRSTFSGTNGRYIITSLARGSGTVRASRSGYSPVEKSITMSGDATLDFDLGPATTAAQADAAMDGPDVVRLRKR